MRVRGLTWPSARPAAEVAPQPLEEPIRAELFGVERLEQHAGSLAAAQHVMSESEKGVDGVPHNGRASIPLADDQKSHRIRIVLG